MYRQVEILQIDKLGVKEVRSSSQYKSTKPSIKSRTLYVTLMIIGIPILLALSMIAASPPF
jgi:hypothetical protein